MDISGLAHLFGGEAALVEDVRKRFAGLGLSSRVAVAQTPGAAWALCHFCPSPLAGEGGARRAAVGGRGGDGPASPLSPRAFGESPSPSRGEGLAALLAPLPVAALRLSPHAVRTLERLGLKTIGALVGVPRRSLARRFREADNHGVLDRAWDANPNR